MRYLILLFFSICFFLSQAQYISPEKGLVFEDSEVPRVDIFIDNDSLNMMLDWGNLSSNHEYPATFVFARVSYILAWVVRGTPL